MKKLLIVIGCLAAGAVGARQRNLAQLAPSQFADTEVSTNVPCALSLPSLKEYRIGLGLVGTPSNNVEVALGHDADGDGVLSLDEATISLAWDCGEWIVSLRSTRWDSRPSSSRTAQARRLITAETTATSPCKSHGRRRWQSKAEYRPRAVAERSGDATAGSSAFKVG